LGSPIFRLITTKRIQYANEQEVRAFLWIMDPHAGGNRHIDADNRIHPLPLTPTPPSVRKGHRRRVDLRPLITEIIASPWASSTTCNQIRQFVHDNGYTISVQLSDLSRYQALLP